MSITKQYTVWCDICSDWDQVTSSTAARAWKAVKRSGWKQKKVDGELKHVCPACVDRAQRV